VTWCVVTETCYLLQKRVGIDVPKTLIHKISTGELQVFNLKTKHCQRIEELMQKYRDLPMDLADASLVILAEELGSGQILSVDYRDFNTYRWKNTEPFQNLFQEQM
jgi:predicted nucleic acid-binding protein